MQITVRMPVEYGKKLKDLSKQMGIKRSDIIRLALKKFLDEDHVIEHRFPFQKVNHLLGIVASDRSDLGQSHRHYLIDKIKRGTK